MKLMSIAAGAMVATVLAACGSALRHPAQVRPTGASPRTSRAHRRRDVDSVPLALVTAESRNRLIVVDLRTGAVRHRIELPADPEDVAVGGDTAAVVSSAERTVALVSLRTLRVAALVHGFTAPHIVTVTPDARSAYVTDDAAGTVTPIRLRDARKFPSLAIGASAHHLTFSPDGQTAWVALGESATTIVELDTRDAAHPHIAGRWQPGFTVHDLHFSPAGTAVWLSSATGPDVTVVDPRTHAVRFRIRVGPPPQHIAFGPGGAYLTSGYGSLIERADPTSGRILGRAPAPYGSFELDARAGYVVSTSLLHGTLTIFDPRLRLRRTERLAPATREVAITT
jgi:DNA-binding beta-propeller fold protein YncE